MELEKLLLKIYVLESYKNKEFKSQDAIYSSERINQAVKELVIDKFLDLSVDFKITTDGVKELAFLHHYLNHVKL